MRYIPIDNGIQQHGGHGGIWLVLCVYRYTYCMAAGGGRYAVGAGRHSREKHGISMQQVVYLCTICEHSIQPPSPELRNARVRVSRARACVRYIIILLYYYIIIFIYTQYIQYTQLYPTMVI